MDPDDKVVAELDVFVCNHHLQQLGSKLVLLQHPLRPTWRPYENSADTAARFKPVANRLELTIPFNHQEGPNYNPDVEEAKKAGALTLRSTAVDAPNTSLAVGVIKDGALLLLPVHQTYQMRPQLNHLNTAAAGGGKDETDEEMDEAPADVKPELTALEVQIKRRETERQVAARQRSYAYLQQQEEAEAWKPLAVHSDGSAVSEALKDKVMQVEPAAHQLPVGQPLTRVAYLAALSPVSSTTPAAGLLGGEATAAAAALEHPGGSGAGRSGLGGGPRAGAPAAGSGAGPSGLGSAGPGGGANGEGAATVLQAVTPALAAAMGPALRALFKESPVNNLGDVRRWLGGEWDARKAGSEATAAAARRGAFLTDAALGEFLAGEPVEGLPGSGCHEHIRGSYIQKGAGPPGCEHLRLIVLQMLRTKASLKKSEVLHTATQAGLPANESQYQRVMKELCKNHGNNWTLKTGRGA